MKTTAHGQTNFLQELRDLLAIVVMLVALKMMLFGDVPLGAVLQHILPDRAIASNHVPVSAPITPAPVTNNRRIDVDAYASMSHRLDYLNDLLQTMSAAPKPAHGTASASENETSR